MYSNEHHLKITTFNDNSVKVVYTHNEMHKFRIIER